MIAINRVAKVVKGGRRFSFNALVAVGDGKGKVGVATGKANEVSEAVRKAVDAAKRNMIEVPRTGATIPHEIIGRARRRPRAAEARRHRYRRHRRRPDAGGARRAPASPTSSPRASAPPNPHNMVGATMDALSRLVSVRQVARERGIEVSDLAYKPRQEG